MKILKNSTRKTQSKIFILKYKYFLIFFFTLILAYLTFFKIELIINKIYKYEFATLNDLREYANFYPENYNIENNDWTDPSFTNLYKNTLKQSLLNKILIKTRIKKAPIWNSEKFVTLLDKISEYRTNKQLKSPFNKTIELKKNDKCIIFGDLHASFHSLIRDLEELEKQKIIDKNLKILSLNTYIIILGDTINRAPYSLEVLNTLLLLMEKNPENLIYLKGNHETNGYWQNFNTKRQIQIIIPKLADIQNKDNLFDKINLFFNTLPDALIINIEGKENNKIICSNSEKIKLFENKNDVKFMIIGEKRFDLLKETHGLEFLGYECGVAKWSIISCQSSIYNKFFKFYSDAFLELLIGESSSDCVLTLNNRNIKEKDSIYKQTSYDPIFGYKLENESRFTPKNITYIGSTMSLSGIAAPMSDEIKIGLETAILLNNKKKQNLIIPIILDDGYSPKNAKLNINKLLNTYKINTVVSPTGTPTLAFYLNMVKDEKLFVFFPNTGAEIFRNKEIKNLINFRASYTDEAKTTINYLTKMLGLKNFAFFYQNDAYGKPISEVAHEELKKANIQKWTDLPHLKTQSEFGLIAEKLKSSMPEAIGCFSTNSVTQEFIEELGPDFFSGRILFGVSFLFSETFKKFLDDRGIKYILTGVVPDPDNSELEITKEFRHEIKSKGLKINSNSFEGFIAGSLISDAINKIQQPFTGEKIIKYFENMKNYNFKGLNLTFNPEKQDLSQPVWLRTLDLKWINYKY